MSTAKRVLIVDDNPDILEVLGIILRHANYETEQSSSGELLVNLAERESYPDAIILDVLLSGHDGRELCRGLKDDPRTKKIPVIMISAYPAAAKTAAAAGADRFLQKPFSMVEILRTVDEVTENAE